MTTQSSTYTNAPSGKNNSNCGYQPFSIRTRCRKEPALGGYCRFDIFRNGLTVPEKNL
ncbi:hypothetical protein I6E64_04120 [Bacteroides fragilis]|uniref:hypothetical protein n=1 Tax=Bacteroides TaxID=816 RepID=UPI0013052FC0|nr:hypothetical protein [Bacteroides fragilis]MBE7398175.1 hypothetical protein [Bacteroides fragilis]MCE8558979.1 hypothetical protein [Bacteroides fragilis]MCF2688250.1 hypothetical protein [Bacteroides fragilis]MCZ2543585.1 hypothetical protein [Bacteroides fragilis]